MRLTSYQIHDDVSEAFRREARLATQSFLEGEIDTDEFRISIRRLLARADEAFTIAIDAFLENRASEQVPLTRPEPSLLDPQAEFPSTPQDLSHVRPE